MTHGRAWISPVRALIHGFPMCNEEPDMGDAFASNSLTNLLVNLGFPSAYTTDDGPLADVQRDYFQ